MRRSVIVEAGRTTGAFGKLTKSAVSGAYNFNPNYSQTSNRMTAAVAPAQWLGSNGLPYTIVQTAGAPDIYGPNGELLGPESRAELALDKAYALFAQGFAFLSGADPDYDYRFQCQRRGFTANCEVVDPGTRQALGLGVVKAVLGGIPDPGPGHYGNASWYFISGFAGVDAPHLVWIINVDPSLLGQLAGAEFHSEFSPFGPLAPFHLLDLVASHLLPNSSWQRFTCSYNGGCH